MKATWFIVRDVIISVVMFAVFMLAAVGAATVILSLRNESPEKEQSPVLRSDMATGEQWTSSK